MARNRSDRRATVLCKHTVRLVSIICQYSAAIGKHLTRFCCGPGNMPFWREGEQYMITHLGGDYYSSIEGNKKQKQEMGKKNRQLKVWTISTTRTHLDCSVHARLASVLAKRLAHAHGKWQRRECINTVNRTDVR